MKLLNFFDILEDKIRHYLSHWPIGYALVGIVGIVLTWRGVWLLADGFNLNPWLSILIGVVILLSTGLLVAIAIGDEVLISTWRGRRKVTEIRTEDAVTLVERVEEVKNLLDRIELRLGAIKEEEEKIAKDIKEKSN